MSLIVCGTFETPEAAASFPLWLWALALAGGFLVLSVPAVLASPAVRIDDHLLLGASLLYAMLLVGAYASTDSYAFAAAVLISLMLLWIPLFKQRGIHPFPVCAGLAGAVAAAVLLGVFFTGASGAVTCLRYANYRAPNFDFGLFCQMFHYMDETLLPLTTCERNGLLSHFAVHLSPIWYLLLPVYHLFPSPYTLQLAQAVVLACGLIPLLFLCRKRRLSPKAAAALCALYALYPALSTGGFLRHPRELLPPPLLLTLFACYEYRRYPLMFASALAVMLVKEDAAVYVIFSPCSSVSRRRTGGTPLSLGAFALLYFALALVWLQAAGEGAMFGRYDNLTGRTGCSLCRRHCCAAPDFSSPSCSTPPPGIRASGCICSSCWFRWRGCR